MVDERFIFQSVISDVSEHSEVVEGRKINDKAELVHRSTGWFIAFSGMQFYVGEQKPLAEKGAFVRLMIEITNPRIIDAFAVPTNEKPKPLTLVEMD